MSVAGPCGGNNAYGANGVHEIAAESTMTLTINYNGGHKSPQNAFRAEYLCNAGGLVAGRIIDKFISKKYHAGQQTLK